MDCQGHIRLPLPDSWYDNRRNESKRRLTSKKGAKSMTFTAGQSQQEVFAVDEGDWEIVQLVIDGANFGDGLNSYAECFIDRSGLFSNAAPLGTRVGAGYFGGFTPFITLTRLRVHQGESVYLSVENGTDADVTTLVEYEIRRIVG